MMAKNYHYQKPMRNWRGERRAHQANPCARGAGAAEQPISTETLCPDDSSHATDFLLFRFRRWTGSHIQSVLPSYGTGLTERNKHIPIISRMSSVYVPVVHNEDVVFIVLLMGQDTSVFFLHSAFKVYSNSFVSLLPASFSLMHTHLPNIYI